MALGRWQPSSQGTATSFPPAFQLPSSSLSSMDNHQSIYDIVTSLYHLDLTNRIVKIQGQYAEGGRLGDVYKCQLKSSSGTTEVAVKAFRFRFTLEGETADNSSKISRRKFGIWRSLSHKNVVPFLGIAYGFGIRNSMSLVSLWMPNGTLQSFLTNYDNYLITTHRLQLLVDIANGLSYLHSFSVPIVHGDLHCNNVLLDADYTARLTDFCYASSVEATSEASAYLQRSAMRSGSIRWIAPEQVLCDSKERFRKTKKSDVYSFGNIALQVLSGKQPWSEIYEDTSVVICLAQGRRPARPKSRPIDDQHWEFINICWSPIEEHRPSSRRIVSTIKQFLYQHSPAQSICDLITSFSRQSHPRCTRHVSALDSWEHNGMRNAGLLSG